MNGAESLVRTLVVTGAADGHSRITGKRSCTLRHLSADLGNGDELARELRRTFARRGPHLVELVL